jgi:hypothetical protein
MPITLDGTAGITTPDLTDTSLTATRVVYAGASGNLTGSTNLIFDGANLGVGGAPSAWNTISVLQVKNAAYGGYTNSAYMSANYYYASGEKYISTAPLTVYVQDANIAQHTWYGAPSGTAGSAAILTQILAITRGGTLSLEGAVPQTGTGITFPATQSASSNANTLDDYEEGTWTPTFFGTTTAGSPTYNTRVAAYTKIGRSVSVTCFMYITNLGGMTGNIQIGGLPFTSMTSGSYYGGFAVAEFEGFTFAAGRTQLGLEPTHGSTNIVIYNSGSGVSASQQTIANTANSTIIIFSGTYFSA